MREYFCGILVLLCVFAAAPAHARKQTKRKSSKPGVRVKADQSELMVPRTPAQKEYDALAVRLPTLVRASNESSRLRRQVSEWIRAWRTKQYKRANDIRKQLHQLRHATGTPNAYVVSLAFIREAEQALARGEASRSIQLYKDAAAFAPSYWTPHYRLAWLIVRYDTAKVYRATKHLLKAFRLHVNNLFGLAVTSINILRYLMWVLGFAFLFFWVLLMLRSLPSFQSDFRDLFPDGVTHFQIQLLSLFLIFLPLLMGAGLLETLLCWIAISWFYQTNKERIYTTVGLLLLSVVPIGAEWTGKLASLAGSPQESVYLLSQTDMGTSERSRLRKLALRKGADPHIAWALGLHYKRKGQFSLARTMYKRAYKKSRNPALLVNIANIDFILGRGAEAFQGYKKALAKRGMYAGQYNLSLIFKHSTSMDVVSQKVDALTAARASGGQRLEAFVSQSTLHTNRYLVDVPIPNKYYLLSFLKMKDQTQLTSRLWGYAATWIPKAFAPWVGLGMVVLLWILFPIGRRYFRGKPCTRCGRIIGWKEQHAGNTESECNQCLELSGKRESISAERRVKKELEIQRHKRRRSILLTFAAVGCMGAGQLLLRESTKAFLLLFFLGSIAFVWLYPAPLLAYAFGGGGSQSLVMPIGLSLIGLLLYIRSVRYVLAKR